MDGQNGIPERGSFKKGRLHVGGEVAAVTLARVERRPLIADRAARVLPCLPSVVPMEPKLRQNAGDGRRLLIRELNPNPLPNNLGNLKKAGRFTAKQRQQFVGFQRPVRVP